MTDQLFSDDDLNELRSTPKQVTNPNARWVDKPGHKQRNYEAETEHGTRYQVYQRQNTQDRKDFSCGLALIQKGERPLSLVRYNGASHRHGSIHYHCHIHRSTAEAIAAGKKEDSQAEETDRYRTLEGALACLIQDCGIRGLAVPGEQEGLFYGA